MNKLLKPIFCVLFLLAFGYKIFGQRRTLVQPPPYGPVHLPGQRFMPAKKPNPGRKIELVKEDYIGIRLKLTQEEARAFWPLYRQYVQDQTAIRILKRQNNSNASANGTVQIDKELAYEQQLVEIRRHYRDEFLKILPPEKVSELYKSEREFNDEVLRQLSERTVRPGN